MIAIIDYGMGNLRSVQKAFEHVGAEANVTQDPQDIRKAAKVVLPGVGAIRPAMEKLESMGMINPIKEVIKTNKPFLGICLGLQLLFDESNEGGRVKGLGILPGTVERFQSLKVPHMGWNQIQIKQSGCALFAEIANNSFVYFCHSFFVRPKEKNLNATTTDYGMEFTSAICQKNIFGVQFHPEKSQGLGLKILKNFKDKT